MKWQAGLLILANLLGVAAAQARVFDINSENFASYLRFQQGNSSLAKTPFAPASGASAEFDQSISTQMGYEFGFVYSAKYLNVRFAIEVLKPPNYQTIKGAAADGTEWLTLNNNITVAVPKIGIEANVKQWKTSRFFLAVDYGSASATIENSYKMTAAGSAQFGGLADFREEVKGNGSMLSYSMGYEFFAFDTTTLMLDVGYRQLQIKSFSHSIESTGFQGAVAKGAPALNTDGTERTANFDGAYASLSLRFWIQ